MFVGGTGVAVGSPGPQAMTTAVTATATVASQSGRCLLVRGFLNCSLRVLVGCVSVAQVRLLFGASDAVEPRASPCDFAHRRRFLH